MQVKTATRILDASPHDAFAYLAEPKNHPEWATEFIERLEEADGELWAETQMGRVRYAVDADAGSGVIDIVATPPEGPAARFPTRVVALGPETSVYMFTLAQPPGMPDEEYERGLESLERELDNLRQRFVSR